MLATFEERIPAARKKTKFRSAQELSATLSHLFFERSVAATRLLRAVIAEGPLRSIACCCRAVLSLDVRCALIRNSAKLVNLQKLAPERCTYSARNAEDAGE